MNKLEQTVTSINESLQRVSETLVAHAIERDKSDRKLLKELDEALLKAKSTVYNLQKARL